jgi:hypothetical protein
VAETKTIAVQNERKAGLYMLDSPEFMRLIVA